MSRIPSQEQQPGRYNGISGFLNRMERRSQPVTEDPVMSGIVAYLTFILDVPSEDVRKVLDAPHPTLHDVTIRTLVSTAINDLSSDNSAIHVVVIHNQEDPFIQAGIIHSVDHPGSMPLAVSLMLNSASPEAFSWTQVDQIPTTASLLSAVNAFATAGYILLDELSKNGTMVVRKNGK